MDRGLGGKITKPRGEHANQRREKEEGLTLRSYLGSKEMGKGVQTPIMPPRIGEERIHLQKNGGGRTEKKKRSGGSATMPNLVGEKQLEAGGPVSIEKQKPRFGRRKRNARSLDRVRMRLPGREPGRKEKRC